MVPVQVDLKIVDCFKYARCLDPAGVATTRRAAFEAKCNFILESRFSKCLNTRQEQSNKHSVGIVFSCFLARYFPQLDKVGRRPFLLWGAVGVTASLVALSIGFATEQPPLSFTACCALVAAYAVSFGPVTWLITAEMFPAGIRGKALGIGQVRHQPTAFICTLF